MARLVGSPKTGGRKSGTPNKRTGLLLDQLDSLGLDVTAEIVKTLPDLDTKSRVGALIGLLPFIYPKRKALEHSGQIISVQSTLSDSSEEERKARRAKILLRNRQLLQCDEEYALEMVKAILAMKVSRTLPDEALTLLTTEFKTPK